MPFLKFWEQNCNYSGHKHVETGPNYSHQLVTFLKYHTPLRDNNKDNRKVLSIWKLIQLDLFFIESQLPIPDCKTIGREKMYQFRIRAVNVADGNQHLIGPWSEPGEGNCYSDGKLIFYFFKDFINFKNIYIIFLFRSIL